MRVVVASVVASVAAAAVVAACDPAPSAAEVAIEPEPGAVPRASAAPRATARADAGADAGSDLADAGLGDGGAGCGVRGRPDCPLQGWMKRVANPPMLDRDLPALAEAFDAMVPQAPAGYPYWTSIAKDGARAARAGELEAARAACRSCHDQYKQKYRAEHRTRPL